jgi:hypothetical protein
VTAASDRALHVPFQRNEEAIARNVPFGQRPYSKPHHDFGTDDEGNGMRCVESGAGNKSRDRPHWALPPRQRGINCYANVDVAFPPAIHLAAVQQDIRRAATCEQGNSAISAAIRHDCIECRA